jgi:hypothetical protein
MPGADEDYSRALERRLALGGAGLDERVGAVATGLGLTAEYLAERDVARRARPSGLRNYVGTHAALQARARAQ